MTKLKRRNNTYSITKPKQFIKDGEISTTIVLQVLNFAFNMSFGELGKHRAYRSGGELKRKNGEIFANTFQGKLAEFAVQELLTSKGLALPYPDLDVYGLGDWDNYDFIYNGYKIAIKSTKYYGQLLLLETKDWNANGEYIPNIDKGDGSSTYDFFILVRVKPSVEDLLKEKGYFYNERLIEGKGISHKEMIKREYNILKNLFGLNGNTSEFEYDIPGTISQKTLLHIIREKYILPKRAFLNKTRMDAENYYVQAGNMKDLDLLIERIK